MSDESEKPWELVILGSALADIDAGYRFYESQEEGLGAYFEESIFSDMDVLLLNAGIHHVAFGYHRLLSSKFPYAIYYKLEDKFVKIQAVFDCRQNPKSIKDRLSGY